MYKSGQLLEITSDFEGGYISVPVLDCYGFAELFSITTKDELLHGDTCMYIKTIVLNQFTFKINEYSYYSQTLENENQQEHLFVEVLYYNKFNKNLKTGWLYPSNVKPL